MKVKNSIVIRIIAKLIFFLCCSHIPFKYFLSVVDHVEGGGVSYAMEIWNIKANIYKQSAFSFSCCTQCKYRSEVQDCRK